MHLSAQLEEFAQNSLQSRGIGPVITEPDDTGAYSDGDPDEFPLWRVHHLVRTLGFRGWHFEEFD